MRNHANHTCIDWVRVRSANETQTVCKWSLLTSERRFLRRYLQLTNGPKHQHRPMEALVLCRQSEIGEAPPGTEARRRPLAKEAQYMHHKADKHDA